MTLPCKRTVVVPGVIIPQKALEHCLIRQADAFIDMVKAAANIPEGEWIRIFREDIFGFEKFFKGSPINPGDFGRWRYAVFKNQTANGNIKELVKKIAEVTKGPPVGSEPRRRIPRGHPACLQPPKTPLLPAQR